MDTIERFKRRAQARYMEQEQHPRLPLMLFATPLLGGMAMMIGTPTVAGAVGAVGWALPMLMMALGTFALAEYGMCKLLPGLDKSDVAEFARFCIAPVWIAEAVRIAVTTVGHMAGVWHQPALFHNVFDPLRMPCNPGDLLTVAGFAGLYMRLRFVANRSNRGIATARLVASSAVIATVVCLSYVLGGLAAAYPMLGTAA